jgi:hypothetical protein
MTPAQEKPSLDPTENAMNADETALLPPPPEEHVRALLEACGLPLTAADDAEVRPDHHFSLDDLRRGAASRN